RVHHSAECMRLALADARQWVADPEPVTLPLAALLSTRYAARRRGSINPRQASPGALPGELPSGSDTIYLAVVDGAGNACSLIQSLYMGVGTGLVVPGTGISLQNRGAGFSLQPGHPNELGPGKRPYHTIIPAITTRGGRLHACFGVMGGFMQPQGHFQVLVNLLDLGLNPQQALDAPRWQLPVPGDSTAALWLEPGLGDDVLAELARRGHHLTLHEGFSRVHFGGGQIITRDPASGVLAGGSDPRKDGCAAGW
ncbi:MAG: gamma-glutamyltransferase, partial [Planctomycetes bacterium]|nr:gamma-glutamyltransferase [Planctomycetota bacterium]